MAAPPRDTIQPGWLLPAVAAIVLALAATRLVVAGHVGLSFDEAYYTFWSERLATGYLDHPPAVAAMIALGRWLAGDTELGVRLVAVVASVVLSGLLYRLGVLLFDARVAALAVLWYNLAPVAGLSFVTTPDPPSVLFWTATLWAVAEFIGSRRPWWWLVAGVLAGLGLWSNYTDAFLAPGLVLLLVSSRSRRQWLKLWQVWAGGALALVVFSPVIWWNAERHWASFTFQGSRTVTSGIAPNFLVNFGDLIAGQALFMAPILAGLALAGGILFLRRPGAAERQGLALPVLTAVPALAYFLFHTLHDRVDANWLIPLWPALTLVAAWAVLRLELYRPWLAKAAVVVQMLLGAGLIGFVYAQALYAPFALGALDRTNETRGWPAVEAKILGLAEANGARWIATQGNYGITGQVAAYTLFAHSPLPVRQIDEPLRWDFLPAFDPDATGWPALFVGVGEAPNRWFGTVRLVGSFSRESRHGPLETWSAFVVSDPTPLFYAGLKR
jgi:4-amino-4-deoxy-L-arabinose transferase-like glycosyltransferase